MIQVKLKDKFVTYEFELYDKYTLLKGDSAKGKTSLFKLIADYYRAPDSVQCTGYKKLRDLPFTKEISEIKSALYSNSEYVFIMDENHPLLQMKGFEQLLKQSDNYFIIISREEIFKDLPIHLHSIVTIKESGTFHTFEPLYSVDDTV